MTERPGSRRTPEFIGEIVEKRHPVLVGIVFLFGIFLASVPFLFRVERSAYREALELYDGMCEAKADGDVGAFMHALAPRFAAMGGEEAAFMMSRLVCVDRLRSRVSMEPVPGRRFGADRAYELTIVPRYGPMKDVPIVMRFEMDGEVLYWAPSRSLNHQ